VEQSPLVEDGNISATSQKEPNGSLTCLQEPVTCLLLSLDV